MTPDSIAAYERPARVASYDADMDMMHPNRHKMVEIALEILPFDPQSPRWIWVPARASLLRDFWSGFLEQQ